MKVFSALALGLIRFYQKFLSPLKPASCRFHPTCSEYARDCFKRFGFFKALWLSIKRICKCHPWNEGGFDPVPDNALTPDP